MRRTRAGAPAPDPDLPLETLKAVRFRVAGLTLALHAPPRTAGAALLPRLRRFATDRGADIRLELSVARPPVPRDRPLFESGGLWRVHAWRGGFLYTFRTPRLAPPVYKAVAMDAWLRRGTLYFPRPARGVRPRYALDYPLDELLFQHRLARDGALEVHAAAVVIGGGAAIFCGRSGAGKTTTARLWRRHRPGTVVLSDDRVVLRTRGGRPWVFGTPWHGLGGFVSPEARPLAGVFMLRRGRRTRLRRLKAPATAARLLARSFPPPWDETAVARALDLCARVAQTVPCFELAFRPDRSAVEVAAAGLTPSVFGG